LEQVVQAVINIGDFEHLQVVDLYHVHALRVEKAVKYKRLKDTVTHQYKNYRYPEYTHIPFNPQTDEYPYPLDAIGVNYDGLHPSNKGYKIIASKLVHIMKKI
jgi:lysophospholipase L1-like esterase